MILFDKDWDEYPYAIADFETSNPSFLRYCGLLKKMGIKNHLFPLQLHFKELQGVDPYDENLTEDQLALILAELTINPFYYFREVLKVQSSGGSGLVDYRANRGNMASTWAYFNNITTMLIMIRQQGKSLFADGLNKLINNYMTMHSNTVIVTKDTTLRSTNANRLKEIEETLPRLLKRVLKGDLQNSEIITNKAYDNTIRILIAQKSIIAARKLNRGSTTANTFVDEVAYLDNIDISLPVIISAGITARKEARKVGAPAGVLLYTTTGYLDTKSGAYTQKLCSSAAKFTEELFDLRDKQELEDYVVKHSTGQFDMLLVEVNHTMLGITDDELRRMIRESGLSKTAAQVELMNIWQKGSKTSILSRATIDSLYKYMDGGPTVTIVKNRFAVKRYVDEYEILNTASIISIDASELLGGDSTSLLMSDIITGGTLLSGKYNSANITEFAEMVYELLKRYPKSTLIIERNNMGIAILDHIALMFRRDNKNIFKRVFNTIVQDGMYNQIVKSDRNALVLYEDYKAKFGYRTSGSGAYSRDMLYNLLTDSVDLLIKQIKDKDLIDELVKLEIKNNRIDHSSGEHDDMVIAFLLTQWFYKYGKNLGVYGINAGSILAGVTLTENEEAKREKREEDDMLTNMAKSIDENLEIIKKYGSISKKGFIAKCKLQRIQRTLPQRLATNFNIDAKIKRIEEDIKYKTNKSRTKVKNKVFAFAS